MSKPSLHLRVDRQEGGTADWSLVSKEGEVASTHRAKGSSLADVDAWMAWYKDALG